MTRNSRAKQDEPASMDAGTDLVNEASDESFPASDAPSWTVIAGEREDNDLGVAHNQGGCTPSFIMQERGEFGGICHEQPNPTEQYVQPDAEKEAGGEG